MSKLRLALLFLGLGLIAFAAVRFFSKPEPVRDKSLELEDSIRRSIRLEKIRKLNQRFVRVRDSIRKEKAAGRDVSELERDWDRAAEIGQKGLYDLADKMLETIELRLPPEPYGEAVPPVGPGYGRGVSAPNAVGIRPPHAVRERPPEPAGERGQ